MTRRWVVVAVVAAGVLAGATAIASPSRGGLTSVPNAQDKAPGMVRANLLSQELTEAPVAQGALKLDGATADVPSYGYLGNGPMVPAFGSAAEAQKTEPDKNTYLRLRGLHGPDPSYDYGRHFLFQGHEAGSPGYITRINLDADGPHRVTLLATHDSSGAALPDFDGSTWDPWAHRLLLTEENGANGGVWQATPDYPATADNLSSVFGKAGYEGVQNDDRGNVYLAEDTGGPTSKTPGLTHSRQPNSFMFRFKPRNPADLKAGGTLQALQVLDANGHPIVFGGTSAAAIDADIQSPQNHALRTYGNTFQTRWVDATPDPATLDANAAAKAAGATPFKRPENFQFRPGSHFRELFFDETGDTALLSADEAAKDPGGYGSIFRLRQNPRSDRGSISLFFAGDVDHASFDNAAFLSADKVSFVEDRGDGFHTDANRLDSGWVFDAREDYGAAHARPPVRWLAEGRDPSATIDSGLAGQSGFTNEGDNEITGIHVSDGDPTSAGILGAQVPRLFRHGWRWFWTQQHGDNTTWEVTPSSSARR